MPKKKNKKKKKKKNKTTTSLPEGSAKAADADLLVAEPVAAEPVAAEPVAAEPVVAPPATPAESALPAPGADEASPVGVPSEETTTVPAEEATAEVDAPAAGLDAGEADEKNNELATAMPSQQELADEVEGSASNKDSEAEESVDGEAGEFAANDLDEDGSADASTDPANDAGTDGVDAGANIDADEDAIAAAGEGSDDDEGSLGAEAFDVEDDEDDEDDSNALLGSSKTDDSSSILVDGDTGPAPSKHEDGDNAVVTVTVNGGRIERRDTEFYLDQLEGKGLSHEHSLAALIQEKSDVHIRKRVFYMLLCMQLFANFDAGVVPSSLNTIMREYELTQTEAGLLGSLVYVGLVVSCPITGYLLNVMKSQRRVLIGSLLLNLTALVLFVLCPNDGKWLLMFTRFLTGLSQAPLFVFPPVWIDEFAPPDSLTTWVSCLQAMVPLGIMFGYLFTAIFMETISDEVGWRVAIWMQIIVLTPFAIVYSFLRGRYFNVLGGKEARLVDQARKLQRTSLEDELAAAEARQKAKEEKALAKAKRRDAKGADAESSSTNLLSNSDSGDRTTDMTVISTESDNSNEGSVSLRVDSLAMMENLDELEKEALSMGQQMCIILTRPVFLWIVGGLSGLYFVVTGIQFWVTAYMINVVGAKKIDVQIAFAITSLTGPLAGVFFGGWLVDKMGGYKEDESATANTLKTCLLFGVGAVIFSVMTSFLQHFIGGIIGIWLVLFFGGALLPALTGVCMTSVPEDCRAVASSFSMFTYNIFGYALAPLLMGGIADAFVDPLDASCRNATKGAVPCASEVQGQLVGFQVGMLMATVAIIAVTGAVICQMRLATQGASPKCLAWIKYAAPSESPEEESRASSSGTALRYNANFFGWYDRDGIGGSDDGTRSRSSSRDGVQPGRRERFETDLMSVQEDSDEESSSGESDSSTGPDAI
eukprot:g5351.t1